MAKRMTCCCCGEGCVGKQWWNRDTGYSLCVKCADFIATKETPEAMQRSYGIRGVHYDIPLSDKEAARLGETSTDTT